MKLDTTAIPDNEFLKIAPPKNLTAKNKPKNNNL